MDSPRTQALQFLSTKVSEGNKGSPRLPNLGELARQAGVSRVTMHKAVREFAAKGILQCAPRTGIRLASAVSSAGRDRPLSGKSRSIRQTIERDIIDGAFQDNTLPSLKELCVRYGTTYQTMKKVTDDLVRCRIAERALTRFTVLRPLMLSGGVKVVLFLDADFLSSLEWGFMASRGFGFLSQLENACVERRLNLETVRIGDTTDPARALRNARGALVWASSPSSFSFAGSLLHLDLPVVLIDVLGDAEIPESFMRARRLTIHRIADETAGAVLGRHLLHLGHRRIAYLSHDAAFGLAYTQRRFCGVRRAFDDAGLKPEDAVFFSRQKPMTGDGPVADVNALPSQQALRQARARISSVDVPLLIRDTIARRLEESDYFIELGRTMGACFEAALADRSITAWIAEGDNMGAHAVLPFLRAKGVAVPQRVSVAAFESTALSVQAGLTVADFRIHSCAHAAIEEILRAHDRRQRTDGANTREIVPQVVERGSCGRRPNIGKRD